MIATYPWLFDKMVNNNKLRSCKVNKKFTSSPEVKKLSNIMLHFTRTQYILVNHFINELCSWRKRRWCWGCRHGYGFKALRIRIEKLGGWTKSKNAPYHGQSWGAGYLFAESGSVSVWSNPDLFFSCPTTKTLPPPYCSHCGFFLSGPVFTPPPSS